LNGEPPGEPGAHPRRTAERLLIRLSRGSPSGPYIVGDLREEYQKIARRRGRVLAGAWYWAQVLAIGGRMAVGRLTESGGGGMESLVKDAEYCFRTLRRRPLFTAVVVATLGLGIGATTTMYSVLHAVLGSDLPYRDADRLASVWQSAEDVEWNEDTWGGRWERVQLTFPQFRLLKEASGAFQEVAAYSQSSSMISTGGAEPRRVSVGVASASLFSTLGLEPLLGRGFLPEEESGTPGQAMNVAVLGYQMWRSRFASDPNVLGETLALDGRTFTVVGVLGPRFRLRSAEDDPMSTGRSDVWVPIGQPGWQFGGLNDSALDWEVVGRLAPGATVEQAQAEAQAILAGISPGFQSTIRVIPRRADESLTLDPRLMLMTAATFLLLLIVCVNVAILFMGELHGRRQEIATRVALGAGRLRIIRQLLTEGAALGLMGSALGVVTAVVGTKVLVALAPPIPRIDQLGVDGPVLLFAVLVGVGVGILSGSFPILMNTADSDASSLSSAAGRTTTGRSRRFQGTLVSLEVALTVLLLVSGGLLTRSLFQLLAVDPGFRAEEVATARISLPSTANDPNLFPPLVREVVRELDGNPEVVSASAAGGLPFGAGIIGGDGLSFGSGDTASEEREFARRIHVLPGFHETLGIPLLAGRTFLDADGPDSPPVLIVSESMARRTWPDRSPIGETVTHWGEPKIVVGVVGDVKLEGLGIDQEPTFYVSLYQIPRTEIDFVVRTVGDPRQVLNRIRQVVWSVDRDIPVIRASTMEALVSQSASEERFRTMIMVVFAITASVLAAGGVFGVTARSVARRKREMGVRLALGAQKSSVVGLVLTGSLRSGLLGMGLGLGGALAVSNLLSGFLFGVDPWDPLTYGCVALLTLVMCVGASYPPAWGATKVDPGESLRI
jgi:putative ABC transport system permease protein